MNDIEENIVKALEEELTISEISLKLNLNRTTVSKYLAVLEARNIVKHRDIGRAKLFSKRRKNE